MAPTDRLTPFRNELAKMQRALEGKLVSGTFPLEIAMWRTTVEMMESSIKNNADELIKTYLARSSGRDNSLWTKDIFNLAELRLQPSIRDPVRFELLRKEYNTHAAYMRDHVRQGRIWWEDNHIIRAYYHPVTVQLVDLIAVILKVDAFTYHEHDEDFLSWGPLAALGRLLTEDRPDLFAALRAAVWLPDYYEVADIPQANYASKPEAYKDAVEFVISFIPLVGSLVLAYEAIAGKDLFGRELSNVDRGVLAAGVLLPWAARAVKSGRSLYTAKRMATLYGDDALKHSYALAMGERLSSDVTGWAKLRSAQKAVEEGKQISAEAASELSEFLSKLFRDARIAKPKVVDHTFEKAFNALAIRYSKFAGLDAVAIERIASKGVNVSHVKGQLLEELLENQVINWLRQGTGKKALGLEHIKGEIQFIPGHLVRDLRGRQITDGILVTQVGAQLQIVAVFECKAGKSAARELSRAAMSRGELSKEAEQELRAYAKDILREIEEQARLNGRPVTDTVESIMKEVKLTEHGGQVRRDIERLADSAIMIGGEKINVQVSPKTTKFFGVIPSDVKAEIITKQLAENGITNFEVIGVGLSAGELKRAAKQLADSLQLDLIDP